MENGEEIRFGISALLEQFWIVKKESPEEFHVIRKYKSVIQQYFISNFGYRLVDAPGMYKLEKIPRTAEAWMGVSTFKNKIAYAMFTAFLAFLDEKSPDDLFLIATASEYVKNFFDSHETFTPTWENYDHRVGFVQALQHAQKMGLIDHLEGELEKFKNDEQEEVLYQPTLLAKHYLRFFTKPITEYQEPSELLVDGWKEQKENGPREHLHSINRRLFFSPVTYKNEWSVEEQRYFQMQNKRISDNIAEHTDYELEVYRNEMLLVAMEKDQSLDQYPDNKAIAHIALHFGTFLREKVDALEDMPEFSYHITRHEFDNWVQQLYDRYKEGWSKEYREMRIESLSKSLLSFLQEWKLASYDEELYSVQLYPTAVRITGEYPQKNGE